MRLKGLAGLIVIGIALVPWSKAWAIPFFARVQERPCYTCHVAFPKLDPFGITFKQNGYRATTEEGSYVWESKSFPLAGFVLFKYVNKTVEDNESGDSLFEEGKFELDEVEFFSGGALSRRFSYFMDFASEEDEPFAPGVAFLIVNDLVSDAQLNLKVGRMDTEFPYLSEPRGLTLQGYLAEGLITRENVGIEANGFLPAGLRYAAGFGNDATTDVDPTEPDPDVTAGYVLASYTMADQTVGVRFYSMDAGPDDDPQTETQFDANLDLHAGPVNLVLAFYKQDNVGGFEDVEQTNFLAEFIYILMVSDESRVALSARYETRDMEDPAVDEDEEDSLFVLSAAFYPIANVRFVAEFSTLTGDECGLCADFGVPTDEQKFQLATQFGF
jgi:hypothetical protein